MAFQVTLPPSIVSKMTKSEEGEEPKKQSREDWRKMKELEEARKAGTAPAMQDEEGKDINPHIPQYIMQAPWYFGTTAATLKHQRPQPEKQKEFSEMGAWYKKGIKEGQISTKYRKGSCENCGAVTHKKKDCLERPRKTGAKFTGEDFAPDEYIQTQLSFDYDGKRDRWNGFDITEHQQIVQEEFAKIEEAKRVHKDQNMDKLISEESKQKTDRDSDDEDKYAEDMEMPGQKFETKQRITVRNLRIREDTAKYLYNLDVNSAFYDPKTRSMRDTPSEMKCKDPSDATYSGDNFVRSSGDAHKFAKMQLFAWEAYERGADVHLQADPTKSELLVQEFDKRKDDFKTDQKQSILDKYGGHEHLEAPPKQLLLAQTENYVEYSRHGSVIKGQEKIVIRSKYEEDIFLNNHSSVWGSYWKDGQWGFKCCHSLIKESYCTGESGKVANVNDENCPLTEANRQIVPQNEQNIERVQFKSPEELCLNSKKNKKKKKKEKKKKKKHKRQHSDDSSEESSSDEEKQKQKKLEKALKKEDKHQRDVAQLMQMDERKRPYNSMYDAKAPTEEEIEAYHMKRSRYEDPMASFGS